MLPREEGQDGARLAGLVPIIEVVGAGIVEVHGLLHKPQAEHTGVEVDIARGRTRNGSDVVDAILRHGKILLARLRFRSSNRKGGPRLRGRRSPCPMSGPPSCSLR